MVRDIVETARARAVASHGDQMYGSQPYSVHLDAVAALLIPYGDDARAVGYLHDTLEDTRLEAHTIEALFGKSIREAVEHLTDRPGANRMERKARTYAHMMTLDARRHPDRLALIAKPADRLANVREAVASNNVKIWRMYHNEHPTFLKAAFRPYLCDEFWLELEMLLHPAHRPDSD